MLRQALGNVGLAGLAGTRWPLEDNLPLVSSSSRVGTSSWRWGWRSWRRCSLRDIVSNLGPSPDLEALQSSFASRRARRLFLDGDLRRAGGAGGRGLASEVAADDGFRLSFVWAWEASGPAGAAWKSVGRAESRGARAAAKG